MICRCPTCGDTVNYNAGEKNISCTSCGNEFNVKSIVNEQAWEELETMDCKVYSCTACGKRIIISDVEVSTFCAHCGQPTIVFNRIAKTVRPQKIIPFKVTEEEAVRTATESLKKNLFIDKNYKNIKIEKAFGVYVPYWIFDISYMNKQVIEWESILDDLYRLKYQYVKSKYSYIEGKCYFDKMTVDASKQFADESSYMLEPYDISELKPFEVAYLSGFYADCFDLNKKEVTELAVNRARKIYNDEIIKYIPIGGHFVRFLTDFPDYKIESAEYAMLPVWLISYEKNATPFTLLVNGQTGKLASGIPYSEKKIKAGICGLGSILMVLFTTLTVVLQPLLEFYPQAREYVVIALAILAFALIGYGGKIFKKVKKSINLTTSYTISDFIKERDHKGRD
ncbi:MAG: hypothetical protein E7270_03650 [Lachnospiraceae bacterium]|nr:hypothetical protein [Lachnospiraceae bacterium]